jgi:DNA-binding GntR family transcriptional regulator
MELPSVGELIYNEIRTRILNGNYASGDRLNVDELARQLKASKTPIREALGRLERAGLATFRSRSGWSVVSLELHEFIDYLEMQFALRSFLSDNLAEYVDRINFDLLQSINQKLHLSVQKLDYQEVIKQNDLFHMVILSVHPNKIMLSKLEDLNGLVRLQRVHFLERENSHLPTVTVNAYEQHQKMMEVLKMRDTEHISQVFRHHNESIITAYRLILRNSQG